MPQRRLPLSWLFHPLSSFKHKLQNINVKMLQCFLAGSTGALLMPESFPGIIPLGQAQAGGLSGTGPPSEPGGSSGRQPRFWTVGLGEAPHGLPEAPVKIPPPLIGQEKGLYFQDFPMVVKGVIPGSIAVDHGFAFPRGWARTGFPVTQMKGGD